jgi:hypothetical protein
MVSPLLFALFLHCFAKVPGLSSNAGLNRCGNQNAYHREQPINSKPRSRKDSKAPAPYLQDAMHARP